MTVLAGMEGLHVPEGWAYDRPAGRLSLVPSALEVGSACTATFSARVGGRAAQAGHVILRLEGSGGGLLSAVRAGALVVVERPGGRRRPPSPGRGSGSLPRPMDGCWM